MKNSFSNITKWLLSLGNEITRITTVDFITSVTASLVAQVSLLITFLLPLKILMLMSTQTLPGFLPVPIQAIGMELLVIILCVLTLFFYLLQSKASKFADRSSVKGAQIILNSANKILLFDSQKDLAQNSYKQLIELFSCLLFSVLALLVLAWFYLEVAIVIVASGTCQPNLHQFFKS